MRASQVFIATVIALVAGCRPHAAGPKINAPISPKDVQEICALVRAATSEPISEISEVITDAYIPGVTPRKSTSSGKDGTHETTMYPCPDRVWVFTQPAHGAPLGFDIRRKDGKWSVVKTERVIYR